MPPVAPSERVVTTRLIDVLAAAVAVALAIVVALDLDVVGRPVLALVFVLAVPGWTVLRVIGVPFGPLTPALAFVISVAIAVATSMVAVSWLGWAWKESAIMWAGLSLMGLSSRLSFDLLTRVNTSPLVATTEPVEEYLVTAGGALPPLWPEAERLPLNEPVAIQVGNDLTVPTKDSNSTMHVLFNTFATGALGAAFWIVAAQLFPERAVASAVGASSLLVVVSFIAQLNLATSLSRFLPGGGAKQRHMVTYSYQISVLCSVVAGAIVVLVGLARGGSVIEGGDIWLTAAIALSIPVWTIFALQDGALVAVRKAHWLAIENGSTAAAKIILLGLFIAIPGQAPILVAWTLPAVPAVLLVNRALYRGLLGTGERMEKPSTLIRYAGFDMVGTSATLLSLRAVPLIVVETTAGNEAAYVGVPLSILTVAAVALMAVSRVVLAEMSHAPERSDEVAKRIHRFVMSLLIPGSIVAALLSYPALRFAGAEYATGGALVLAIGMLGLIPAADVESHFARLRYADRMTRVSVIQLIRVGVFLGFTAIVVVIERPELIGAAYAAANLVTVPIARWTT